MNSSKKIRHLQSLLYTSGVGIILFSLWSGIRNIEIFFEAMKDISYTEIPNNIVDEKTFYLIMGILFFIVIGGSIFLHIYIGRKAILFSLGKIKRNRYVIWAILIFCLSLYTYVYDWQDRNWKELLKPDQIVLFVIDFTSNIILAEIAIFSIILKKLRD